jgi:hypothetical protein
VSVPRSGRRGALTPSREVPSFGRSSLLSSWNALQAMTAYMQAMTAYVQAMTAYVQAMTAYV